MINFLEEENKHINILMKELRNDQDPFIITNLEFKTIFKLSKEAALHLINFLSPYIEPG